MPSINQLVQITWLDTNSEFGTIIEILSLVTIVVDLKDQGALELQFFKSKANYDFK